MSVSTKILCIFDGFGLAPASPNNCISLAKMPNFRHLLKENFWTTLNADGEYVGQESGLVGNSEVGHMNIGGLKLVPQLSYQITKSSQNSFEIDKDIAPDQIFAPTKFLASHYKKNSNKTIHLIGLFSTGTIHSDLRHWIGVIESSLLAGSTKIVLHLITDGRDSDKKSLVQSWQEFSSALIYKLNKNPKLNEINWESKIFLGSVGGRFFAMDRDKNWGRVKNGLVAMIENSLIETEIDFTKKLEEELVVHQYTTSFNYAIDNLQIISSILTEVATDSYSKEVFDEYVHPTSIQNIATVSAQYNNLQINKNDTVWLINFRTDRMKQFSQMFCDLNKQFNLNLTVLAMNDYGDGNAVEVGSDKVGYFPIFSSKPLENTLAQTISQLNTTTSQVPPMLILVGPSGSGKGTLVRHLLENYPTKFGLSISCTTRAKREGEVNGKEYYFITKDEFENKIKNDEFLEYEEVYAGTYYGTLKSEIQRIQNLNQLPLFEVDYRGALNIKKNYSNVIDIFLLPPSEEVLEQRLRARGTETEEQIQERLKVAKLEIDHQKEFTYQIVNNEWSETIVSIEKILGKISSSENLQDLDRQKIINLTQVLWNYAKLDQNLEKSDLIWAFGSSDLGVARQAANLYLQGLAPKILFTGKGSSFSTAEAEEFSKVAIEMGVPEEDIWIENKSMNTGENIQFAYKLLQEKNFQPQKIIAVTKPYDERRNMAALQVQWLDKSTKFYFSSQEISLENYLENYFEEKINAIVKAVDRIKFYPEKGFQSYQEIPSKVWQAYLGLINMSFDKKIKFNQTKISKQNLQTPAKLLTQLHISETEKYNHVTYFFNGGQDKKWSGEDWIVIPSNKVASHAEIPEMKAKEVTDKILEVLGGGVEIETNINNSKASVQKNQVETKDYITAQNQASDKESFQEIQYSKIDSPKKLVESNKPSVSESSQNSDTKYNYIIVNYANPDMVGHTGDIEASIRSMEFLDEQLGRLLEAVENGGHEMIIIADHGNMEFVGEFLEAGKNLTDTEHNSNPVPCVFIGQKWKMQSPEINQAKTNLISKLLELKNQNICNPDVEMVKQVLAQTNQVDLNDPETWLTREQIHQIRPQLPLWYAGVLLLGL